MNLISQTAYDYWHRVRVKNSPSGWLTRNGVCCEHRGETRDKRGRCGIKINHDETLSVHCFNCGFTASYTPGRPLYPKFQNFLRWLGLDETTLGKLKLESLRTSSVDNQGVVKVRRDIKAIELPECNLLINDIENHQEHIDFLKSRGFDPNSYSFLVSNTLTYRSRVIVPFITHNTIVGYSARSIKPNEKNRFIMKMTTDFVFGMEFVDDSHEWVILQEGIFDALSIKGLATMHNEISDAQAEMIHDLGKRVIVVPDMDPAGVANRDNSLINTAIDFGWNVSFPEWNVKDVNKAYCEYGPLFTVAHILKTATDNPTSIRLRQKMLVNRFKKKAI